MTEVRPVDAEAVRPLRHRVLRLMQAPEAVVYPGDDDPLARHSGVFEDGELVGVGTIAPDRHPLSPRAGDWRIRGMATAPEVRRRGLGARLLDACVAHARAHGARRVWCNARADAVTLYARAGFEVEGERFEIVPIGPHYLMALEL